MPEDWNVQTAERFIDNDYYHYEYYVRDGGRDITVETHYRTKQDHVPLNSFEKFVSDHEEMYNNLTFQVNYNKNLIGNKPGISWLGIITALITLAFGLWMALRLYYYYDPKPAIEIWDGGQPIGGWLILVALGLVLSPFRMIVDLFNIPEVYDSQTWANLLALKRYGLFAFTLLTHVYNVLFFSYMILIIVLFIRRRSSLPKLIIIFYGVNCFMTVIDSLVGAVVDPSVAHQPAYYRNVFSSIIAAAIWIPYFNTSSRVKETFVVQISDDNDDAGYAGALATADPTDAENRS
jgi:magnesium-transporting ATPase (P-type)